jgi:hypothetical protein
MLGYAWRMIPIVASQPRLSTILRPSSMAGPRCHPLLQAGLMIPYFPFPSNIAKSSSACLSGLTFGKTAATRRDSSMR